MPTPMSDMVPPISAIDANDLAAFYAMLRDRQCRLPDVTDECLPFQYADDLCYVMADHIAALLAEPPLALTAAKVWLHGSLRMTAPDRHSTIPAGIPGGTADGLYIYTWQYHVAAILRRTGSEGRDGLLVVDPAVSLDGPLDLDEWRARVGGLAVEPVFTTRAIFNQAAPGVFILPFDQHSTRQGLEIMRKKLRQRAAAAAAAPAHDA